MNMVNTTYISTEDMIIRLQELKSKTKLNFYKNISNFYEEMKIKKFRYEQDPFVKNAQGLSKTYHEVFALRKFLQTIPQIKNVNTNYYDL